MSDESINSSIQRDSLFNEEVLNEPKDLKYKVVNL